MIAPDMKQMAITLIDEAAASGARLHKACAVLGISRVAPIAAGRQPSTCKTPGKGLPNTAPTP